MPLPPDIQKARKEVRFDCRGLLDLLEHSGEKQINRGAALVRDISESGACIQTDVTLPVGTTVSLRNRSTEIRACVRNVGKDRTGILLGLEFLDGFRWHPESPLLEVPATKAIPRLTKPSGPRPATPAKVQKPLVVPQPKPGLLLDAVIKQIARLHKSFVESIHPADQAVPAVTQTFEAAKALCDESSLASVVISRTGQIRYVNQQFRDLVRDEPLRSTIDCYIHREDLPAFGEVLASLSQQDMGHIGRLELRVRLGVVAFQKMNSDWQFSADDSSVLGVFDPVPEDEPSESSDFVQHAGQLTIWEWDIAAGLISFDPQTLALHGLTEDTRSLTFLEWISLVEPDYRDLTEAAFRLAASGEKALRMDTRITRPDGSVVSIACRSEALTYKNGKPAKLSGASFDIS
ncbi:MAG: PAS domain-containing protein [Bryobacteraceae bacterium]|nr:PAS domain-containing protein [Bryobacteraceae bacterium]